MNHWYSDLVHHLLCLLRAAPVPRAAVSRRERPAGLALVVCFAIALAAMLGVLSGCTEDAGDHIYASSAGAGSAASPANPSRSKEDAARAELEQVPPPVKSRYLSVQDRRQYGNPFLVVHPRTITLTVNFPDENPHAFDTGGMMRPAAARRQQLEVRTGDLANALGSLPPYVWPYGRVVAIEEAAGPKNERVAIRRNVETTMNILNQLGIVADEWASNGAQTR